MTTIGLDSKDWKTFTRTWDNRSRNHDFPIIMSNNNVQNFSAKYLPKLCVPYKKKKKKKTVVGEKRNENREKWNNKTLEVFPSCFRGLRCDGIIPIITRFRRPYLTPLSLSRLWWGWRINLFLWAVRGGSDDGDDEHPTSSCDLFAEGAMMGTTKRNHHPHHSETPGFRTRSSLTTRKKKYYDRP